jgi:hypothetical protein
VVRELVEAARQSGLKVGLYLSPADLHEMEAPGGRYGNGSPVVESTIPSLAARHESSPRFSFAVDDYNRYYLNQLYELLTEYGPIHEVWFDGANPKPGVAESYNDTDWFALVRALAPEAVMFNGPDIRWVGNESGLARESEWSVIPFQGAPETGLRALDALRDDLGSRDALCASNEGSQASQRYLAWYPAEVDVSIRPGWFYHPEEDAQVKSLAHLMHIYEYSLGRNGLLLLNIPPDQRGRFADPDCARLLEPFQRRAAPHLPARPGAGRAAGWQPGPGTQRPTPDLLVAAWQRLQRRAAAGPAPAGQLQPALAARAHRAWPAGRGLCHRRLAGRRLERNRQRDHHWLQTHPENPPGCIHQPPAPAHPVGPRRASYPARRPILFLMMMIGFGFANPNHSSLIGFRHQAADHLHEIEQVAAGKTAGVADFEGVADNDVTHRVAR